MLHRHVSRGATQPPNVTCYARNRPVCDSLRRVANRPSHTALRRSRMVQSAPLVSYPDVESRVEALRRDGYVYFPGVLNADEIAELRAAMDRLEARQESFDRDSTDGGYREKHIKCVFNRDAHFLQFLDRPGVFEVAPGNADQPRGQAGHRVPHNRHDGLGDRPRTARPGPARRLAAVPGAGGCRVRPARPGAGTVATAHYYLDDLYEELGPTKFIRAATAPEGPRTAPPSGTDRASSLCCARPATWSCSGARCGTGARRTAAGRPGTCCRSTTPTA